MVVAVPRSKMMQGNGYFATAATAPATKSAPNWAGLSILIFSPVLIPGPNNIGVMPVTFINACFIVSLNSGTTEQMITSWMECSSIWYRDNSWLIAMAYWSSVLRCSVKKRAINEGVCATDLSFIWNPPIMIWVLPMSTVSNISFSSR